MFHHWFDPQMQPILWLYGDSTLDKDIAIVHVQAPFVMQCHSRQKTSELCPRKPLSNAAPGSMKKSYEIIIAVCAPGGIYLLPRARTVIISYPSFGLELIRCGSP